MQTFLVVLALLLLAGCGKHYWTKPGADFDAFARDSETCARQSAAFATPDRTKGIVNTNAYRYCLSSLGWQRGQHNEPVPDGWFRGIENNEDVVALDIPPEQPRRTAVPPSTSTRSHTNFGAR